MNIQWLMIRVGWRSIWRDSLIKGNESLSLKSLLPELRCQVEVIQQCSGLKCAYNLTAIVHDKSWMKGKLYTACTFWFSEHQTQTLFVNEHFLYFDVFLCIYVCVCVWMRVRVHARACVCAYACAYACACVSVSVIEVKGITTSHYSLLIVARSAHRHKLQFNFFWWLHTHTHTHTHTNSRIPLWIQT